jgi:spermidine synthase
MGLIHKTFRKPGSNTLIGLLFSELNPNLSHSKQLPLVFIGFGSILSQILIVREFLVSFYGNELSIGIIFACWLLWIGIGSAFGNIAVRRLRNVFRLFLILIAIIPLVTFVQILAVKFVRVFIDTTTGEFLSLIDLLGFSFVVLSIGCFIWGMLFTLGAKILTLQEKETWYGVNRAYILESLGSVFGGLLFSFVIASLFSTLQIVFFIFIVAWGVVLWIVLQKRNWKILATSILIIVSVILFPQLHSYEHQINTYQWSLINNKLTFVRSTNTKYQNLSLMRLENQYTIYADGRPVYNIPNTYDAEIFTHSIMVQCMDAKRVLVLGGGFNGVLREILKYPVQEVEYVENDPALLPFVEPVMNTQDQQALRNPRVHIILGDGRGYLRRTNKSFDVILLNVGEPSTASLNRFFTLEFYQQCAIQLTPQGILAFSFPSSTEYLADELKDLNASIYHTFKRVFKSTVIVPGTHAILIGSKDSPLLVSSSDSLATRYRTTGILSEHFSEYMFEELMSAGRVSYITNALESTRHFRLNTDCNPVTYYFDLLLWNRFLHGNNHFFSYLTPMRIFIAEGIALGLLLLFLLLCLHQPDKQERTTLATVIFCGGMIGMALNLLFLLNFQETFGSVYEMVGAMIAANMLGMALGTLVVSKVIGKSIPKNMLLVVLISIIIVVFLLPKLLDYLLVVRLIPVTLLVTVLSGGLIGMLFGTVNQFYLRTSSNLGSIYAFDVIGSSIGALITCSVLLPILGIQDTRLFLVLILIPALLAATLLRTKT